VGAYGRPTALGSPGAAFVFVRNNGVWSQQQELTASDAAFLDFFGNSVAISGDTAIVGAFQKSSNTGAALENRGSIPAVESRSISSGKSKLGPTNVSELWHVTSYKEVL
jgi:FG-GAP repeat